MAFLDQSHEEAIREEREREEARQREVAQAKALAKARARSATIFKLACVGVTILAITAGFAMIDARKSRDEADRQIINLATRSIATGESLDAEDDHLGALVWYAAHSFDAMPDEAPLMACHVLAHVSEIAREIASVSTQVHGGIGWTDEQNLHFWFKRIGNARLLLGGPELLRNRAAELQGFAPAA